MAKASLKLVGLGKLRLEQDSMGSVQVPAQAYWGAQTQRAIENFPISGSRLPAELIRALGLVKLCCAKVNRGLGSFKGKGKARLEPRCVEALCAACKEVAGGALADQFPVDLYQTGSGTSSNMNVNEVIANRAIEIAGGDRFSPKKAIHPNDHVNLGQSSNDIFPTAVHVAAAVRVDQDLIPALVRLHASSLARPRAGTGC